MLGVDGVITVTSVAVRVSLDMIVTEVVALVEGMINKEQQCIVILTLAEIVILTLAEIVILTLAQRVT